MSYGNSYLKSQLLKRYGDSVYIANSDGLHDIITFRETTTNILHDYFNRPNMDGEEAHKRAIIAAAVKFIKSDIKAYVKSTMNEYPQTDKFSLESSLEYLPPSLRFMLQHLLVGKDTRQKQASIGKAIIQGTRPRITLAPLQIGLAVQMHHHFRSRFLIDNLFALGFCSSFSEVQRFEENAAATAAPDVLGNANMPGSMLLFATDNVDHNIILSLDDKGTFHGMGMVACITPANKVPW